MIIQIQSKKSIEAIQYDGTNEREIIDWAKPKSSYIKSGGVNRFEFEGITIHKTDWFINLNLTMIVCTNEQFTDTYDT